MSQITVIVILLLVTFGHELAHALVASALGYKVKKIYFGIPLEVKIFGKIRSPILYKTYIRGVEVGISWLILGGMVDFDDSGRVPFWKMSLIAVAGPLSNFLFALIPMILILGISSGWSVTIFLVNTFLESIGLLITGAVPFTALSGVVSMVSSFSIMATTYSHGWLLVWLMINIGLAVTNILPVPALDGGHIMMAGFTSVLGSLFGEKYVKAGDNITRMSLNVLMVLMIFVMAKGILF